VLLPFSGADLLTAASDEDAWQWARLSSRSVLEMRLAKTAELIGAGSARACLTAAVRVSAGELTPPTNGGPTGMRSQVCHP
jgi:hypothetical protein